jgi:hypothetical protein
VPAPYLLAKGVISDAVRNSSLSILYQQGEVLIIAGHFKSVLSREVIIAEEFKSTLENQQHHWLTLPRS